MGTIQLLSPPIPILDPFSARTPTMVTRLLLTEMILPIAFGDELNNCLNISWPISITLLFKLKSCSLNVGSGVSTKVQTIADSLKKLYLSDVDINVSGNYRLGDIRHNKADISKIKKLLGFSPKVSFEDGLKQFVNWVKKQEVNSDNYEQSINEMKDKGLMKWK